MSHAATGVTAALDNNGAALSLASLTISAISSVQPGGTAIPGINTMEIADILCVGDQLEFISDNIFLADDSADCTYNS
jgi:hypothetical protein